MNFLEHAEEFMAYTLGECYEVRDYVVTEYLKLQEACFASLPYR